MALLYRNSYLSNLICVSIFSSYLLFYTVMVNTCFLSCSCFLSNPIVFFVAFLGPILAIILINVVVFIIIIAILIKHTRGTLARKKDSMSLQTVVRLMISVSGIMFLFGITWLFAALTVTINEISVPFQVLFTIFNSFQGFFIFLFFCVFSQEARESWKEVLSCGRYKSDILNPTMKWSKNTANKQKNHKYGTGISTSDYSSRKSESTAVFSSNEESTLGYDYNSGKKNIELNEYSDVGYRGGGEKVDLSSTSGIKDERSNSDVSSELEPDGAIYLSANRDTGRHESTEALLGGTGEKSGKIEMEIDIDNEDGVIKNIYFIEEDGQTLQVEEASLGFNAKEL